MKIFSRTYVESDYHVSFYVKGIRGLLSHKVIQTWVLTASSAENAKWFAIDILSGMTLTEIFEDSLLDSKLIDKYRQFLLNNYNLDSNDLLGFETASTAFTFLVERE